jgi:hypothetical protein
MPDFPPYRKWQPWPGSAYLLALTLSVTAALIGIALLYFLIVSYTQPVFYWGKVTPASWGMVYFFDGKCALTAFIGDREEVDSAVWRIFTKHPSKLIQPVANFEFSSIQVNRSTRMYYTSFPTILGVANFSLIPIIVYMMKRAAFGRGRYGPSRKRASLVSKRC